MLEDLESEIITYFPEAEMEDFKVSNLGYFFFQKKDKSFPVNNGADDPPGL